MALWLIFINEGLFEACWSSVIVSCYFQLEQCYCQLEQCYLLSLNSVICFHGAVISVITAVSFDFNLAVIFVITEQCFVGTEQ